MPKKSGFWLAIVLGSLLLLVSACGGTPGSVRNANSASLSGDLYVLGGTSVQNASSASLRIVSFQPGSTKPGIKLPNGLVSLDHQHLYTAASQQGHTTITVYQTRDASVERSFTIAGNYSTADTMFDRAVISFDGHWLALRSLPTGVSSTTIALIDTQAGKQVKTIQLAGDFDLDAISPDGSRVYLLQRLNDGTSHYYVRLYEVTKSALMDGFIIDKNEIDETDMNGTPLARQVAVDGSKVFTLYLDTRHNRAFIHILPLVGDYTGARCIDLPAGKDPGLLHYYTLTLSTYQDGTADLYAANGALGVVTRVKVTPDDQVFNIQADPAVHFTGALSPSGATNRALSLHNGAILSADGRALFFIGLQGIWTVNPQKLASDGMEFKRYLMDRTISSLALSPDGKTLYALDADQGILALDAGTGQLRQTFSAPVQSPLGIAWTAG